MLQENPEISRRFPDLHPALGVRAATVESNRCLNCFDAPCTAACPTHIDVPGFIKKIASDNLRGSAVKILEANVLAASCSRVCPVEMLCEGACVMHHRDEKAIAIGQLQRFAMESFYASGGSIPTRHATERSEKIACIGAGPASLACAAELRLQGFQVTVIDRRALPGGLNTYGVAEYKLTAADSLKEIAMIRALGVQFRTVEIVDDSAVTALEAEFDRIFLGIGLGAMHRLNIPGGDHPAIVDALEFISAYKLGRPLAEVESVVVVGAGNTAIDAAIAAKRLGAREVTIVYRRDATSISAFDFEFEHAKREGVEFLWWSMPKLLQINEAGRMEHLICHRTELNPAGELVASDEIACAVRCDLLIPAIGQAPLHDFLLTLRGVEVSGGRIVIDRATGQTTNAKYFAGGDCVNGGREVVDAVADGRRAALGITAALNQLQTATGTGVIHG